MINAVVCFCDSLEPLICQVDAETINDLCSPVKLTPFIQIKHSPRYETINKAVILSSEDKSLPISLDRGIDSLHGNLIILNFNEKDQCFYGLTQDEQCFWYQFMIDNTGDA